ncbi:NAD-dependent epimerase/dehydratase family protein [Colwellia sp. M166]|uniref:NAD-dependent epimerase/dehydratase family protein n=1 Tax=Colwellia sp. M166 TaxID=2583805 RepID=UPI00211F42A0|nr:NAD-dependent epimerase/dehydratase family protein [Colwellia sp. M166]UUO23057.1 NAD-dependent epimerase/dehydratase family protein [Colwellia sp. M166]
MFRDSYVGKVVLVTGGAGFIGSHLVDRLIADGAKQVIIVDNLFIGSEDNIVDAVAKGAVFYNEDIEYKESLEYIFDVHNVDVVFNLATKALNYSFVNPANAFTTNVTGTVNLLELQRKGKFKSLCHFSTSEVYGSAIYEPMDEAHPKVPTTTYAAGKAAADLAVESYVNMFNVDAFIVRPFNNYGPRQNHKGYLAGIIPITAWRIHNDIAPEIHGEGNQSRDFIYVSDTVDAVVKLFTVMPVGESVNISTDNQCKVKDLLQKILTHYNYQGELVKKEARGADVLGHNASNEKVKSLIEYNLTPFDVGLANTLDWYQAKFSG